MAKLKKTEWIFAALVLAIAFAITSSNVQALAVSYPKMEDLNPKGEPWIPARVKENTEFQMTIWGENNATVEVRVRIENENALGFARFDPENFILAPSESKEVRCILTPTKPGAFKSSVVISEYSLENVSGNPITPSIAEDLEVHAELPPSTFNLTKFVILLVGISLIIAVTSLILLKSKSKRGVPRVLTNLVSVIKVTSIPSHIELFSAPYYSIIDRTKEKDNILDREISPVRGWV